MPLKHQVAQKEYDCSLCGKVIAKGTSYWRNYKLGRYDRKEHLNCAEHETGKSPVSASIQWDADTSEGAN